MKPPLELDRGGTRAVLWAATLVGLFWLLGCALPTEPSGCRKYVSDPFFTGEVVVAYQCWGDALPADSLDHPEWW